MHLLKKQRMVTLVFALISLVAYGQKQSVIYPGEEIIFKLMAAELLNMERPIIGMVSNAGKVWNWMIIAM